MARLVAAFGASHSIMLVAQREDWMHGFRDIDRKNAHYIDRDGHPTDYAALLAAAPPGSNALQTPELLSARYDQAQAAMDRLRDAIAAARLDVLLVVGDDQTELFRTSNNPAIAIYHGPTIRNTVRDPAQPGDAWVKTARMWRHEPETDRDYPVHGPLAAWLTRQLCDRDFDITAMDGLTPGQSEGHAFQFIHRRLMDEPTRAALPVVPVILNTFDAPNQPTPRRCVALGEALRLLLGGFDDVDCLAEAVDGEEAVRLVAALQPDVVLMDIRMPRLDGLAATTSASSIMKARRRQPSRGCFMKKFAIASFSQSSSQWSRGTHALCSFTFP